METKKIDGGDFGKLKNHLNNNKGEVMIFGYITNKEQFSSQKLYLKSDKNTREITALFNEHKKRANNLHPHRVNDDEYGVYHHLHISYIKTHEEVIKQLDCDIELVSRDEFFDKCRELNKSTPPTNEADIREATKKYLDNKYDIEYIQDEYTHSSLPVRADLFAVSKDKKVITIEIKSDRDTFTRLRKQLEEYNKFSHIVYLAIDIKHLAKFKKNYPGYYGGILTYEDGELEVYSAAHSSKTIDATRILWKQELLLFTHYFNGSFTKYCISKLEHIIRNVFTVEEYYNISEYLFVNRYIKDELDFKELICDLDYKQKLVDKVVKEIYK